MGRFAFIPVSVGTGLLAGLVSKKIFDALWGMIDDEEPPEPEHRDVTWPKMLAALALQGAIFRVAKGIADHGSRIGYERATGVWPGEEEPDKK
jgi:uncharacterized protein DUF4235